MGVYLGFFIYKWTFQLFWDNFIVLGVLIMTFALVMGGYAYVYAFRLILPITAGLGSFFMLRGVSVLLGGFPTDFTSFTGSSEGLKYTFFYLMAFILLFAIGIYHQ